MLTGYTTLAPPVRIYVLCKGNCIHRKCCLIATAMCKATGLYMTLLIGDSVVELAQYAELFVENDINGKRYRSNSLASTLLWLSLS